MNIYMRLKPAKYKTMSFQICDNLITEQSWNHGICDPELEESKWQQNISYDREDINAAVIEQIKARQKYIFSWKTILFSIFCFPQIVWKWRKLSKNIEQYGLYVEGKRKICEEIDLEFIVKSIRKVLGIYHNFVGKFVDFVTA